MDPQQPPLEVSVTEARRLLSSEETPSLLVDVREPDERTICSVEPSEHIPMGQIPAALGLLPRDKHLLILCHHGGRSMRVTQYLRANGFKSVTNVAGGIDGWAQEIDPTMRRY